MGAADAYGEESSMKKFWLALVVLGLFSTAGIAHAAPGGTDRPFKASGSGPITVSPPQFSGTFHGTHTGGGTYSGTFVSGFPPPCGVGSAPITDFLTLTAANGDTINQTWSGTVCQSGGAFPANPTFHSIQAYTVTGGTGRFSTATGTGSVIGDADFPNGVFNPGTFSFTENGTISF
jgi:hypothetical protein